MKKRKNKNLVVVDLESVSMDPAMAKRIDDIVAMIATKKVQEISNVCTTTIPEGKGVTAEMIISNIEEWRRRVIENNSVTDQHRIKMHEDMMREMMRMRILDPKYSALYTIVP